MQRDSTRMALTGKGSMQKVSTKMVLTKPVLIGKASMWRDLTRMALTVKGLVQKV